jgi:thiamine-phosphate pyrophosphorylase
VKYSKKQIDYSLYLVTDRELAGNRPIEQVVAKAVQGGVSAVQLREKDCSTFEYVALANKIKSIVEHAGVPLIINDRIDVALACHADGVHIGQNDMPYSEARRILGNDVIIGLTVESIEQARIAEQLDADYLGVSTVFATPTKTDTVHEWGLSGLAALRKHSRHMLVAIGGLNNNNIGAVIKAGADGVAVVSAICAAPDPKAAASVLRNIITHTKPNTHET